MAQQCPLCQSASRDVFEIEGYKLRDCVQCQHRFADIDLTLAHTEAHYGDDYFFAGGAGYQDYLAEANLLHAHGKRYGELLNQHMQPGTVLDVGAAAGFILKGMTDTGWTGMGIEPNAGMAAYARNSQGLDVHAGSFEQYVPQQQFDVVTMIQVIAHFYDVTQAIEVALRCLKPGGLLVIETWNRESFPARLLGKSWHEYSPPTVVHWFSAEGLKAFLAPYGLKEIARGQPAKYLSGAHAKSLLSYKLKSMPGGNLLAQPLRLIPDTLNIPYPSFDLFYGLYKKS